MRTTMIAIAALAATPAGAQTRQQVEAMRTPALNQCLNANETTDGMSGCLSAEAKRQDATLNATYKATMARLAPPGQATLRTLERDWIKKRDAKCKAAYDSSGGGSIRVLDFGNCMVDETISRTIWLRQYKG